MLENQLVAGVQLDAGLPIDAFCIQLSAQPALWPGAVATGFSGAAYFTLRCVSEGTRGTWQEEASYRNRCSPPWIVDGVGAWAFFGRRSLFCAGAVGAVAGGCDAVGLGGWGVV